MQLFRSLHRQCRQMRSLHRQCRQMQGAGQRLRLETGQRRLHRLETCQRRLLRRLLPGSRQNGSMQNGSRQNGSMKNGSRQHGRRQTSRLIGRLQRRKRHLPSSSRYHGNCEDQTCRCFVVKNSNNSLSEKAPVGGQTGEAPEGSGSLATTQHCLLAPASQKLRHMPTKCIRLPDSVELLYLQRCIIMYLCI